MPEIAAGATPTVAAVSAGDNLTFYAPWVNLGAIFAVLYPGPLATTFLQARRAARFCPAEPLRFW